MSSNSTCALATRSAKFTLPLVATDMYDLLHGAATDRLHDVELEVHDGVALTVVLASEGYPASPIKGRPIDGLSDVLG